MRSRWELRSQSFPTAERQRQKRPHCRRAARTGLEPRNSRLWLRNGATVCWLASKKMMGLMMIHHGNGFWSIYWLPQMIYDSSQFASSNKWNLLHHAKWIKKMLFFMVNPFQEMDSTQEDQPEKLAFFLVSSRYHGRGKYRNHWSLDPGFSWYLATVQVSLKKCELFQECLIF